MAASQFDLTTLAICKTWSNSVASSSDDVQLQLLLTAVSREIVREVGFPPFLSIKNEVRDGNGGQRVFVRYGPIIKLNSLTIREGEWGGILGMGLPLQPVDVPASNGTNWGYTFDDSTVTLVGYRFPFGKSNVVINYLAGQTDTVFEQTTLVGTTYAALNSAKFVNDLGVTYANGSKLTKVLLDPTAGQYNINMGFVQGPNVIGAGTYGFNVGDIGASIYVNYQFGVVPEDWQQMAAEAVGLLYAAKKHIGLSASSQAGQNQKYIDGGLPPETIRKLNVIKTRVPVV